MSLNSPSFLAVVLDCESLLSFLALRLTATRGDGTSVNVNNILMNLVVFLHSYSIMHRENRLVIFAHGLSGVHAVFPSLETEDGSSTVDFVPWLPTFAELFSSRMEEVIMMEKNCLSSAQSSPARRRHLPTALSSALSIIRHQKTLAQVQPRILTLQFDKDRAQSYNAVMNCVFSAQKLEVTIDAMVCSSFESHLLQQVCFLTEGQYLRHGDAADLLLSLQAHFLADKSTRALLSNPSQKLVDFKANCHCHQKPVEFAMMCSICLTLLCSDQVQKCSKCPVCETPVRGAVST